MLYDIVLQNRSYRRFFESHEISSDILMSLIELARITPSGGNRQVLKFHVANSKEECEAIFPCLAWAAYLGPEGTPKSGERPSAYITILHDTTLGNCNAMDVGIVAQTILLGACEKDLGGCMIGSVMREELTRVLGLDDKYEIPLVIALGKPSETVVIDTAKDGDIKYFRDSESVHHVPKRPISELCVGSSYKNNHK